MWAGWWSITSDKLLRFPDDNHRNLCILFTAYLAEPRFAQYPHLAAWVDLSQSSPKSYTQALSATLRFCRTVTWDEEYKLKGKREP